MTRLKFAELTSWVGALVLGIGLGALVPHWFTGSAVLIVVAGAVCHGFGMWHKHRLDSRRNQSREAGRSSPPPATQTANRAGSASNFVLHDFEQK